MAKTSVSGDGECFILSDILEDLNLSLKQFQRTCIAAGCDYLSNVKGIGINKAYQMVVSGGNFCSCWKVRELPKNTRNPLRRLRQYSNIKQCLIWVPAPQYHLRSGKLNHPQIFSTCVESILLSIAFISNKFQ